MANEKTEAVTTEKKEVVSRNFIEEIIDGRAGTRKSAQDSRRSPTDICTSDMQNRFF